MTSHIVITGPMGAGKTTLGRELALRLHRSFHDSDEYLEQRYGRNGRTIAAELGVEHLHHLERGFVESAAAESGSAVIAAAASIADDPPLLTNLVGDSHLLVFIDADVGEMEAITADGSHRRPMSASDAASLHGTRKQNAVVAGAIVTAVSRSDSLSQAAAVIEAALLERSPSLLDR